MIVRGHPATNVGMMEHAGSKPYNLLLMEDRTHHTNIIEMPR